jgi:hypothetical protein
LQFNRARYYDPLIGKWISMDPLGFKAGDANPYRYVENNTTNSIDPSGLFDPKGAFTGGLLGGLFFPSPWGNIGGFIIGGFFPGSSTAYGTGAIVGGLEGSALGFAGAGPPGALVGGAIGAVIGGVSSLGDAIHDGVDNVEDGFYLGLHDGQVGGMIGGLLGGNLGRPTPRPTTGNKPPEPVIPPGRLGGHSPIFGHPGGDDIPPGTDWAGGQRPLPQGPPPKPSTN